MKKYRVAPELRAQILGRIKNDGVPVSEAAKDHGVSEAAIYRWISKGVSGEPAMKELIKLKKENEQLLALVGKLTIDLSMLKKKGFSNLA
jgi:transposase-like protein